MSKPKREPRHDKHGNLKCRVCGCTEIQPCNPPCSWVKRAGDICTSCYDMATAIIWWSSNVAHLASLAALMREVQGRP